MPSTPPPIPGLGFLTIALGAPRYLRQAEVLSLSLRRNMPGVPLAIVTDSDALAPHADQLIAHDASYPVATAQKLLLDRYSPFESTLFIDSDCIATRGFRDELAAMARHEFTPVAGALVPPTGRDEYVHDLGHALKAVGGAAFPKFNGGVYFFRRGPLATRVFGLAREYFQDARRLGLRSFDRGGPGDETVIGLALAACGLLDLYDDAGRLMRTPTGVRGPLRIDPLGGGCRFARAEGIVEPALCHFAGKYLLSREYRLAERALRTGTPVAHLPALAHAGATLGSAWAHVLRFSQYRVHGLRRRLAAIL